MDGTVRPVRVLGPLEVFDGDHYQWIGAAKWRALLALLVIHCGRIVPVEQISAELWGSSPPRGAMNQIHGYVMRLRRALGDPRLLVTRSPGYQLTVPPAQIDAGRFEQLAADGLALLRTGDAANASARLTEALALWRGPALADVPVTPLVEAEIARLEELRLAVLEARVDADLALGRHADLIVELQTLTRDHPLRERLWSQLMLAMYRSGRSADALAAYRQIHAILRDELGIDPNPELRRLQQHILNTDAALQLVPAPAQLPAGSAAFAGRSTELRQLLEPSAVTTVSGMPGVGKTTLAVRVAHQLAPQFGDGQLFLDLHGFTDGVDPVKPADALNSLLLAIGVHRIPHSADDRAALLRSELSGKRMLVVLDNALNESQVRPLLPGTSGCRVLITSRRRLTSLDDAVQLSLDVLPQSDAVEAFARIAGNHPVVPEIVEFCGRLPLAIRIAAARLRARPAWTHTHLADRLRAENTRLAELDDGERSVTAAFAVSYQRLTPDQQRSFISGQDDRLLEDLVDVHLLQQPAPGRYQHHELLRIYAAALSIPAGTARP